MSKLSLRHSTHIQTGITACLHAQCHVNWERSPLELEVTASSDAFLEQMKKLAPKEVKWSVLSYRISDRSQAPHLRRRPYTRSPKMFSFPFLSHLWPCVLSAAFQIFKGSCSAVDLVQISYTEKGQYCVMVMNSGFITYNLGLFIQPLYGSLLLSVKFG